MTDTAPAARVLDVTRLVSRAGRILTGVDRVERAYLRAVLDDDAAAYGLCRTQLGYILIDRVGLEALLNAVHTNEWGRSDLTSRLLPGLDRRQRAGQSLIRNHAIARIRRQHLQRKLTALDPAIYYNVGHSALNDATLAAVKGAGLTCVVLLHDTIPLDFPQFQRPGSVEAFRTKLTVAARYADHIIAISTVTAADIARHTEGGPAITVAPIGHDPVAPQAMPQRPPYVMALGTIEPRKNHALLLDLWEAGAPGGYELLICGQRGWQNADVFARLDAGISGVTELPDQTDVQVRGLLANAAALVFPSHAEGYGLPLVEAAALGTPVLCGDLAICREVLGDFGVYLPIDDPYQWDNAITSLATAKAPHGSAAFVPPTWAAHFSKVFSLT